MKRPFLALSIALALGAMVVVAGRGSEPALAQETPPGGSLLGPLFAQPTTTGMTVVGTIQKVPAGTKMWVTYFDHKPGAPTKLDFVAEDSNVIVKPDGSFRANLVNPNGTAFREGIYTIQIECRFTSAWRQTVDVLEKAGVELDDQLRSDIYTDPKAIPQSPDFKPNDPEFPNAGRYISVMREVKLGSLPPDAAAIDGVKGATLFVQGSGRSSLPVGGAVEWYARFSGFKPVSWSAVPDASGKWIVTLDCVDGKKPERAQWSYEPKSRDVKYLDHLAKTISYVPAD